MNTIFIGDSITAYWPLPFAETINAGVLGDTPAQVFARFPNDVIQPFPWGVHILCGTNVADTDPALHIPYIRDMANMARDEGIKVILAKIPPRVYAVNAFNDALAAMAASEKFIVVDYFSPMINPDGSQNGALFTDGTHPNAAGYAVMEAQVSPILYALKAYSRLMAQFAEAL